MKKHKIKRTKGESVALWIFFAVFFLYAVSLVFPFIWIFFNSFKMNSEFFGDIWGMPEKWLFSNYAEAFSLKVGRTGIPQMFLNSAILVVVGTLLSVFISSCTAYVISKYRFKGSSFIYAAAILIMLIPSVGSLSATYQLMKSLNLFNKFIGVFLMYSGGFGFNFILLYSFFKTISWSYAEAGMIDGCGDFSIFIRIMLPQAIPALTAIGVIQAIGLWNDYFTPYMFLRSKPTISVGLNLLVSKMTYDANWPVLFALMLITLVPVITVFCVFQKTIMESTVAGGLKG